MAVSAPQQYCLRWNNHQHNLLSVFEDLLNHEAFVDVTLACDGLNLKAHKMVLSACSPYFQSMFYNTPDKHPVVFLKDVRYEEMKALLEFMYRGEVSVDQENLSSLLKVAEGLKIKGLADVNENNSGMSAPRLSLPHNPAPLHLPPYPSSLMSPQHALKRLQTAPSPQGFLGPKRKRGRPRRLSGSEAIPLALNLAEERREEGVPSSPRHQEMVVENEQSPVKSLKEGNRALSLSPRDLKVSDFPSEAESNDGASSGVFGRRHLATGSPQASGSPPGSPQVSRVESDLIHVVDPRTNARGITIQTFSLDNLDTKTINPIFGDHNNINFNSRDQKNESGCASIKLEPGVVQTPPAFAKPLKLEIQDNYVDTEGALIIAEENGMTLDYIVNEDGSCTCKLCGELTQSRTHWYRHKYKVHNVCLFRCEKCEVFFKSKKGFEGHVANRHAPKATVPDMRGKSRKEVEGLNKVLKEIQAKKEAEMVQKIIEKVKAECRAQGEDLDRRGYTKHAN